MMKGHGKFGGVIQGECHHHQLRWGDGGPISVESQGLNVEMLSLPWGCIE